MKGYKQIGSAFAALAFIVLSSSVFGQATKNIPLPTSSVSENEVRFAAIGDAGTGGKNQFKIGEQMARIQRMTSFNLLLSLGDNVYESGSPKDIEKKFIKPYRALFAQGVEFRGVIGNHDARSENGVILQQLIFGMGRDRYYSFSKARNLVEFFGIDSTILAKGKKAERAKDQVAWFENRLANSKSTWKIAFLHHTLFSSAKRHGFDAPDKEEMLRVREILVPLYKKYGVQLSLNGHDHVYERTRPIEGIQYFTSGAGAKLRRGNLQKDSPFYAFGNDLVRSFMLFSVRPDSITFWSISIDGDVLDSGIIRRK